MVTGEMSPPWRNAVQVAATVAAVGTFLSGLVALPALGWRTTVPTTVAVTVALAAVGRWPASRPRLPSAAILVSAVSIAGTLVVGEAAGARITGLLTLVEAAAIMVLVFLTVRFVALRRAAPLGVLLGLAEASLVLRLDAYTTVSEAVGQCAFWSLGAVGAAVGGSYLRMLDDRRRRSVSDAQRTQRIEIARDLHDFVAHDISGIIVLAQAGQLVGADQPQQLLTILTQIEQAGLRALDSMDRTVRMLNGSRDPSRPPEAPQQPAQADHRTYDISDIPDLVDRFRSTGRARVELDLDAPQHLLDQLPRETASTAYRVVVEALTNVRRHAPTAGTVTVRVVPADGGSALAVSVANSTPVPGAGGALDGSRRDGGLGLVGLTERVRALGGSFTAGSRPDGGWRVSAIFPVDPS